MRHDDNDHGLRIGVGGDSLSVHISRFLGEADIWKRKIRSYGINERVQH